MKTIKKEGKLDLTGGDRLGIKGLNMVKRKKLEAYQHLFYLLQVITQRVQLTGSWLEDAKEKLHWENPLQLNLELLFISLSHPQTNPHYLAKLIFQMPQNKSTKFMDAVVFSLYNYASNQREEYLLLKLFKTALEEEVECVPSLYYPVTSSQL